MKHISEVNQRNDTWPTQKKINSTENKNNIPVPIHALRIASLLFLRPNPVSIPITIRGLFLELVPVVSVECFESKPSCLAAANSISRAANFLCCSLTSKIYYISPRWKFKIMIEILDWINIINYSLRTINWSKWHMNTSSPAGYDFQCIIHRYGRLPLK